MSRKKNKKKRIKRKRRKKKGKEREGERRKKWIKGTFGGSSIEHKRKIKDGGGGGV